jgi:hypothetical protein
MADEPHIDEPDDRAPVGKDTDDIAAKLYRMRSGNLGGRQKHRPQAIKSQRLIDQRQAA